MLELMDLNISMKISFTLVYLCIVWRERRMVLLRNGLEELERGGRYGQWRVGVAVQRSYDDLAAVKGSRG